MEQYAQEEVDLIEYLNVLWKRRWLIIVPTVLLVLIAGVVSFLLPPVWEVDAVIQPSKFFVQSAARDVYGNHRCRSQAARGPDQPEILRTRLINAQLNLDPRKFPILKAENPKDTKLVRVSIQTKETEKAKAILNALFQHIKSDMDRKIDVEMKGISTQIVASENKINNKNLDIQSKNIDIEKNSQAIVSAGKKLAISEDRSRSLVDEMKGVKTRVDQIEKQQKTLLAEKKEGVDTLGASLVLQRDPAKLPIL